MFPIFPAQSQQSKLASCGSGWCVTASTTRRWIRARSTIAQRDCAGLSTSSTKFRDQRRGLETGPNHALHPTADRRSYSLLIASTLKVAAQLALVSGG